MVPTVFLRSKTPLKIIAWICITYTKILRPDTLKLQLFLYYTNYNILKQQCQLY